MNVNSYINTNIGISGSEKFKSSNNLNYNPNFNYNSSTKNSSNIINISNINTLNNNISTNGNYLSKINFGSNTNSNTGNLTNSSNSMIYTTYSKLENIAMNKSNDLISPKNIFNTQNMTSHKRLKDFVSLYTKKKLFKNTRNNFKLKDGIDMNNDKNQIDNITITKEINNNNKFLTEQISHFDENNKKKFKKVENFTSASLIKFKSQYQKKHILEIE
jgi:hypothetical protein